MSKSRTILSRPRTKVYDTNYNIGESLYKPALDGLDRKYGNRMGGFDRMGGFERPLSANGDMFGMRAPPPPSPMEMPRSAMREMEENNFFGDAPRRRPNSALLEEFDSIYEGRMRNGMSNERPNERANERYSFRGGRTLEDEIEDDISSSMKRLRAVKASRSVADEFDDMESSYNAKRDSRMRPKLEFSDKMMDSVGLTSRARAALEDEGSTVGRRRFLKIMSSASEMGDNEDLTKWTALKPGMGTGTGMGRRHLVEDEEETSMVHSAAAARARKSRARLEDLESEMQALSDKSAAREKRVRDLKALVQENEASAIDNLQSTVRIKSSIESEKKTMAY